MTTYEMDDLPKDTRSRLQPSPPTSQLNAAPAPPSSQDSEQVWAMAVAIIMTMLMIPLLFFPRVLLFLMETEKSLTPLERFLSNQLGVLLLALAAGTIMTIPEGATIPSGTKTEGHPLLGPISIGASISAFIAWNTEGVGSLGTFVCVAHGLVGAWGFWTMLFSGTSRISKKTGADKHTSAFMFGNRKAASVQKKEWKAQQKKRHD